jgi:mannose-6-phosphate isomerase
VKATDPPSPIKVAPLLDAKPWGGRRLSSCGIALPADLTIGEALLTAPDAIVLSDFAAGSTLADLAGATPETWVGARGLAATGGQPIFPLLIKLIDASADLSVQVHPDDAFAAAASLGTGKTEAWHILDARPDSVLYLGLRSDADANGFFAACRQADGSTARYLRRLPAAPGMTVVVPAGTLHAIGSGLLIYEIQQPSNVTFRLDDWGRRDEAGQARALHHESGFAVLDPKSRPQPISPIILSTAPERALLAATPYFALERLALAPDTSAPVPAVDSPQVLTCLSGTVILATATGQMTAVAGETVITPVGGTATLTTPDTAVVLRGWVPDLERDVIVPCQAAGASPDDISRLGVASASNEYAKFFTVS